LDLKEPKPKHPQVCLPVLRLWGESASGRFWHLEASHILWFKAPSVKTSNTASLCAFLPESHLTLLKARKVLDFKSQCGDLGPKQIFQDNLKVQG
jgi:hypothetical protein